MKKNLLLLLSLLFSLGINAQITYNTTEHNIVILDGATDIVMADIDEDGIKDFLTTGFDGANDIYWYKGEGGGSYTESTKEILHLTAYAKTNVYAADLNNDGHADAVYIGHSDASIIWYANDGAGNFGSGSQIDVNGAIGLVKIFIFDIDNDGYKDIAAIFEGSNSNKLVWYKNDGTGTFSSEKIIFDKSNESNNSNFAPTDLYIADFNSDGYGDIAVADNSSNNRPFRWFINNTDGTWNMDSISFIGSNPWSVSAFDTDKDGDIDIIGGFYGNTNDDKIIIIKNNGDGTFDYSYQVAYNDADAIIKQIYIDDIDNDGDSDIMSSNNDTNGKINFSRNKNNGASFITNEISFTGVNALVFDDVDGDLDKDMIIAAGTKIIWLDNKTPIFTQNPQNSNPVCVGTDSVLFGVKAINAVSYRWQEDYNGSGFSDLSTTNSYYHGVETDTLYVDAWYANMNGYKYRCRIIGANPGFPKDTSEYAVMTVDNAILAKVDPNDHKLKERCEASSLDLDANDPSPHTALWTSNVGSTTFDNASVYNTVARNFGNGTIELYWTIDNKSCGFSTDTITIKNYQNITADAGSNENICDTTNYQLHGNALPALSTGTWTSVRGEVTFDDLHKPDAIASNLPDYDIPFQWEVNNGACGGTTAQIHIYRYQSVVADAGEDQKKCDRSITSIQGSNPGLHGSGYWTSSNAQVVIDNPNNYATNLSNIPHGATTFIWTINTTACPVTSDEMVFNNYSPINIDVQPTDLTVAEGENALFGIQVSGDVKTYQWYKDDNLVTDDTQFTGSDTDTLIIANTVTNNAGVYKCIIVDWCYENDNNSNTAQLIVNASTTGIDNLKNNSFKLYPNPNSGQFKIEATQGKINQLEIINMRGSIVFEKTGEINNTILVDISNYPKGVYILNITIDHKNFKHQIILQ